MSTGKTIALHSAMDKGSGTGTDKQYIIRADRRNVMGVYYDVDKTDEEILAAFEGGKSIVCDTYDYGKFTGRFFLHEVVVFGTPETNYRFKFFAIKDDAKIIQFTIATTYHSGQGTQRSAYPTEYILASENSLPVTLPNPEPVTFIDTLGNETVYDGQRPTSIQLTSSLHWNAVTNKPFMDELLVSDTPFDASIITPGFETFPGASFITTPFELKEGAEYIVTINGDRFESVCTYSEAFQGMAIGNIGALAGGEITYDPYVVGRLDTPMELGGGVVIYGAYMPMILINEWQTYAAGTFSVMRKDVFKPDVLPTMSATTKGCAKIGEGLVMDGDVLRVDHDAIVQQVLAALASQNA